MAVTLTGSNGLFTRLGKVIQILVQVEDHQTNASSGLAAEFEDAIDEYNSADMEYAASLTSSIVDWQKNAANVFNALSQACKDTVIGMVNDDTTLNQPTLYNALIELIDQMGTSNDVKGNVFSVGGTGDGGSVLSGSSSAYIVTSKINGEGKTFQNLHADNTTVVCTRDAQVSGTGGRETFTMKGEKRVTDIRDTLFPGGNGNVNTVSMSDPAFEQQSALGKNSLANGAFETFTVTNTPDNWAIDTGVAGTDILEEGTIVHRGNKSLQILGDGATLTHISQLFNTAGATTVKLRPQTRYCVSFWLHRETAVAAGVLRVSIKDGGGTILDSSAAGLSTTLSGDAADTWVHHSFTFSSPLDLPDSAAFHVELTTAITNTASVYVDGVQIFRMPQITNTSSFHIAVIPGDTDVIVDDFAKLAITKSTTGKFQTHLNRLLGMEDLGLQFPFQTDASESIADSLIA